MRKRASQRAGLDPADGTAAAALAVLLAVALATFRDYGLAWDDYAHSHYGELLLAYYTSGFSDLRAFSFSNLFYYGGGFDLAAAALAKLLSFDVFETRRLLGALVGIAGLAIVWRTARRLGGPVAGVAALVMLAVTPAFYGHMFINAKDLPFAVAMAFLLYTLVRAFDEHPRPSPLTITLFALALGLTIGTRLIGGVAVMFVAAGAAALFFAERRRFGTRGAAGRVLRLAGWLALGLPLAYLVMAVVWPWSVQSPLNPLRALAYYSQFWEQPWKEMFDGVAMPIADMPRTYVAKLCLLKLPEILVVFAITGTVGAALAALAPDVKPRRRASLALLATAAVLPIAITMVTKPVMYNGIRHFLFVLPPFAALAGLSAAYVYERAAEMGTVVLRATGLAFLAIIGVTVWQLVSIHPYQYALFNHLAGGLTGARGHYMLDYWGLGFKEASEEMLAVIQEMHISPPRNRKWQVAVCGPAHTVSIELGPDFVTTYDAKGADFAVSLGTFYCARLDAPIIAVAQRNGVEFARAYDLRGRTYSSMYTPPTADDIEMKYSKVPTFWHQEEEARAPAE